MAPLIKGLPAQVGGRPTSSFTSQRAARPSAGTGVRPAPQKRRCDAPGCPCRTADQPDAIATNDCLRRLNPLTKRRFVGLHRSVVALSAHLRVGNQMCHPGSALRGSPTRRAYSSTSGCDCACTLVIPDNDAIRGDFAFRHLKRRWDRAIGKQPLSNAQRYRIYHQPERID